jgi:hypothetical protein
MCYLINSPMLPEMKASSILPAGEGTWKLPGIVTAD